MKTFDKPPKHAQKTSLDVKRAPPSGPTRSSAAANLQRTIGNRAAQSLLGVHPTKGTPVAATTPLEAEAVDGRTLSKKPSTSEHRAHGQTAGEETVSPFAPEAAPGPNLGSPARVIKLSGGQQIIVYGAYSSTVETALADGWLSFLEMEQLWFQVKTHQSIDNAGHHVMEMLTQRYLATPDTAQEISSLTTREERLTWKSIADLQPIKVPGTVNVSPGEHYMVYDMPSFESRVPESLNPPKVAGALVISVRKLKHEYNMRQALSKIDGASWLAPDDKVALRRLQFLHYIMRYPSDDMPGERLDVPTPTPAQQARYRKLRNTQPLQLTNANALAIEMGLPDQL